MSYASSTVIPARAIVELAATRDGLAHWVRLRALQEALHAGDAPDAGEPMEELDRLLAAAWPDAARHLARLAAFYETHAEAVNASVREALARSDDRRKERLRAAGDDFATAAAARARALADGHATDQGPGEPGTTPPAESPESDFCGSLSTWQEEADVMCIISGDPADCAYAALVASLSDQYC